LQRQDAELTQCLAAQNMEMYRNIDDRDSKSNFKNPYHNPVLIREHRGRDEQFVDKDFHHEEDVEDPSQFLVD